MVKVVAVTMIVVIETVWGLAYCRCRLVAKAIKQKAGREYCVS